MTFERTNVPTELSVNVVPDLGEGTGFLFSLAICLKKLLV